MSDLISRKAALDALKRYQDLESNNFTDTDPVVMMTVATIANCIEEIVNIPSAEPERKKGEWEVQPSTGEDRPFIWWKCSVCGHVIFSETERDKREFHAFCGRCGADMRGE